MRCPWIISQVYIWPLTSIYTAVLLKGLDSPPVVLENKYFWNSHTQFCGKSFKNGKHARRHELSVHLGKTKLNCPTCQKEFSSKENLGRHMQTIHEGKKVLCEVSALNSIIESVGMDDGCDVIFEARCVLFTCSLVLVLLYTCTLVLLHCV